jgi:predicted nucleic acid-binding protein
MSNSSSSAARLLSFMAHLRRHSISISCHAMSATFVDTNVIVYAHHWDEPQKRERALQLLEDLAGRNELVLSTQVLEEFFVTVTRKLQRPLAHHDARDALDAWSRVPLIQVDADLIRLAAQTSEAAKLSFWDALIVETAASRRCTRVLSEDMQHGFEWKGVSIEDPFR